MATTEGARYRLHQRLEQVLGSQEAATLMAHMPPVGWADVATKKDLEQFGRELRLELSDGTNSLRAEMRLETRNLTFAILGANTALTGLAFAAARLL